MKTSVVLATFNGEKFLLTLLKSIKEQTIRVDEVIISDDQSTDSTVAIVRKYIADNQLFNWKVVVNKKNVGFKQNFLQAMRLATGDIIFPCDQDDYWYPEKIEIMKKYMIMKEDIMVAFCKSVAFKDKIFKVVKNSNSVINKISFHEEVKNCYGAGHLLCLRRDFVNKYINDISINKLTFDIPFCLIAAKVNGLYRINDVLVARRFHENNTSGATRYKFDSIKDKGRVIAGRKTRLGYFIFLTKLFGDKNDTEFIDFVRIFSISLSGITNGNIYPVLSELFCRNKYINRLYSICGIVGTLRR